MNISNASITIDYPQIEKILGFLDIQNSIIVGLIFVVLLFIIKPDLVKNIHVYGLAIFRTFRWARRLQTSKRFQLDIGNKSKELNKEMGIDILPHDIRVKLVRNQTKEAFIKDGKVIVKLDDHEDKNRTIALATLCYVDKGFFPEARNYMPRDLFESSSLLITHRLLSNGKPESLDYFIRDILSSIFKEKPLIEERYKFLKSLDNKAFFIQILLPEIWEVGKMFYPDIPDEKIIEEEVEELINFLYEIAVNNDELPPLNFKNRLFSIRLIIVGKQEKLAERGINDYCRRVDQGISLGYKNIYLLAHDNKRRYMQRISNRYEKHALVNSISVREGKSFDRNMKKKITVTYCIKLKNKVDEKARAL